MTQNDRPGSIDHNVTNRTGGKKLHSFVFRNSNSGTLNGVKVEPISFDVHLELSQGDICLALHTKDIPAERFEVVRGSDIAKLRDTAKQKAQDEFDLRHGLTWSDWLEVRATMAAGWELREGKTAKAMMSYSSIRRAETADGQAYMLLPDKGLLVKFPENASILRDEDGKVLDRNNPHGEIRPLSSAWSDDRRDSHTQFTYVPDTPENRAGLDAILQAIEHVNQRLEDFTAPGQIEQTLLRARTGGQALLSGPSERPRTPRP